VKKFGKVYNINVVCAYGGGSMYEQSRACEEGAEIIVATPVSTFMIVLIVVVSIYHRSGADQARLTLI